MLALFSSKAVAAVRRGRSIGKVDNLFFCLFKRLPFVIFYSIMGLFSAGIECAGNAHFSFVFE
jgi:hypothetical protein